MVFSHFWFTFMCCLQIDLLIICKYFIGHVQVNMRAGLLVRYSACIVQVLCPAKKKPEAYIWMWQLNTGIFLFFFAQLWLNFTAAFACTLYTELLQVVCSFTCESNIALGAVLQLRLQANWFTTSEPHVGLKYMQESS